MLLLSTSAQAVPFHAQVDGKGAEQVTGQVCGKSDGGHQGGARRQRLAMPCRPRRNIAMAFVEIEPETA
ncbi:hypothetical protein EGJ51_15395 [Pseudomonas fulva]|nr:hypothetical protein EGJ51_15395 [Pseudomonas fulva]HCL54448.1 hypothetical protein [Pseudomonas sp.]HCP30384.1 hypothetical protein [Pseudomonas sp.]